MPYPLYRPRRLRESPLRLVGVFVHPGQAEKLAVGPTPQTTASPQPARKRAG